MAGTFKIGETKVRPGVYFRTTAIKEEEEQVLDGVVAVLFKANFGPLCKPMEFTDREGYKKLFGTAGTTDIIENAFKGGAKTVIGCRVGKDGTVAAIKLKKEGDNTADILTITAKYSGTQEFALTIRDKISSDTLRECIIYSGTEEYETISFKKGGDEATSLANAFPVSSAFIATVEGDGGELATVNQSAFTVGTNATVTTEDYTKAFEAFETYSFNVLCADTEETAIHQLMAAYLDRIYENGQMAQLVVAEKESVDIENRMDHAAAFNSEKVIYVLNASVTEGEKKLDGYQTAARIAGMVAGYPCNQSLTHKLIPNVTDLLERLTPSKMTEAEQKGCFVLSFNTKGQVWVDNAINTLVIAGDTQDNGWKKIRRVKTRYEVMRRMNNKAEALVGNIDNDKNGRATVISQLQNIGETMIEEQKLIACMVAESEENQADGDSAWFDIAVIDKDSMEHLYLTYQFQFSTNISK